MTDVDLTEDLLARKTRAKNVSEMDKFRLAKTILLMSLLLYVLIALLYAFSEQMFIMDPAKNIWLFSSQGLFGIVNLIIGFYFGGKTANETKEG